MRYCGDEHPYSDGQNIEANIRIDDPFYASFNLHSSKNGTYKCVRFSPEIEEYIIYKNIYKNPGDIVSCFSNASDVIGILFFKFPDDKTMINILEKMNDFVEVLVFDC